jgi:hypothetical protein
VRSRTTSWRRVRPVGFRTQPPARRVRRDQNHAERRRVERRRLLGLRERADPCSGHSLTALVAGVAGAGIGLGLRPLTRKSPAQGDHPDFCAGLAMIVATVGYGIRLVSQRGPHHGPRSGRSSRSASNRRGISRGPMCGPGCAGSSGIRRPRRVETAEGSGIYVVQVRRAGALAATDRAAHPRRLLRKPPRGDSVPDTEISDETANRRMRSGSTCRPTTRSMSAVCGGGAAAS